MTSSFTLVPHTNNKTQSLKHEGRRIQASQEYQLDYPLQMIELRSNQISLEVSQLQSMGGQSSTTQKRKLPQRELHTKVLSNDPNKEMPL